MNNVALEIEQNEVIREVLKVKDLSVLRRLREVLRGNAEEEVSSVAENAVPYKTKAELIADLNEMCEQIKLARAGKLKGRPAEELLNEL